MSQLDLSNIDNAKKFSIALSKFFKEKGIENAKQGIILEGIAKSFGQPNWNTFLAVYKDKPEISTEIVNSNESISWIPKKSLTWNIDHYISTDYKNGYGLSYNIEHQTLKVRNSIIASVESIQYFKLSLKGMKSWGRKLNFILSQEPTSTEKELEKNYRKQKDHQEGSTICGVILNGLFIKNEYGTVEIKNNLEKLLSFFVEIGHYSEAEQKEESERIMDVLHELDTIYQSEDKDGDEQASLNLKEVANEQGKMLTSWIETQKKFNELEDKYKQLNKKTRNLEENEVFSPFNDKLYESIKKMMTVDDLINLDDKTQKLIVEHWKIKTEDFDMGKYFISVEEMVELFNKKELYHIIINSIDLKSILKKIELSIKQQMKINIESLIEKYNISEHIVKKLQSLMETKFAELTYQLQKLEDYDKGRISLEELVNGTLKDKEKQ